VGDWEQVRATCFDVFSSKGDIGYSASRRAWLIVDVERGKEALRLDTRFVGFDDLLGVFNTMTTHLPYQWERDAPDRFTFSTSYARCRAQMWRRRSKSRSTAMRVEQAQG
jgi:hypothetical protein